ncbi:hypothetical protein [Mycolicibacterium pyrenivorans]|uniref:hypothetical protein n=1 Tax=Mycolicibacterium pyrenivorans TaxID=187102 RepID=UPI000B20A46A|nr:hypothetical protein [Mycolicibacterium pyrenivorans]MCV7150313.1 hypothetical protein [Mycolicibacterium pyrenivorans]
MVEFGILLLLVGALVVVAAPWIRRRRGIGNDWLAGTMLVTGVSPRPDGVEGEQFVTITGVISGPTVNEYTVYARIAVDVNDWPTMGQLHPVMYSPKNADNWRFAPQEVPPPPPPPAQGY